MCFGKDIAFLVGHIVAPIHLPSNRSQIPRARGLNVCMYSSFQFFYFCSLYGTTDLWNMLTKHLDKDINKLYKKTISL